MAVRIVQIKDSFSSSSNGIQAGVGTSVNSKEISKNQQSDLSNTANSAINQNLNLRNVKVSDAVIYNFTSSANSYSNRPARIDKIKDYESAKESADNLSEKINNEEDLSKDAHGFIGSNSSSHLNEQ